MGFLVLSILSSALVSVIMRISTGRSGNQMAFFGANYTVCTLLSLLFAAGHGARGSWEGAGFALFLGVVSGVMYLVSFMLLRKNVQENGVVLAAVFMKLGVLVPTLAAVVIYGEKMSGAGAAGFLLALLAIVVVNGKEEPGTGDSREAAGNRRMLLVILLLAGGFTDTLAKVFENHGLPAMKDVYLIGTFATALVLCVCLTLRKRRAVTGQDLLWGMLIGIPNYFCSRFLLSALERLPAVAVYPIYNIGAILLVTLAGVLLFREKISRRKGLGLLLILAALVLLNL